MGFCLDGALGAVICCFRASIFIEKANLALSFDELRKVMGLFFFVWFGVILFGLFFSLFFPILSF